MSREVVIVNIFGGREEERERRREGEKERRREGEKEREREGERERGRVLKFLHRWSDRNI
ncbi:hypothetical protein [Scytonema sp. HK-05]|uniref:hypothetical protein n=1 Tax=Scytonema sp. HK-05 TaxID=1137095 RepID=UPI00093754ED|nr:hypothetical protein [Scytonema sp. HK-05]OKH52889.1 hypothetical protein NIES2130_31285 [Scytonema sp. HK-05]